MAEYRDCACMVQEDGTFFFECEAHTKLRQENEGLRESRDGWRKQACRDAKGWNEAGRKLNGLAAQLEAAEARAEKWRSEQGEAAYTSREERIRANTAESDLAAARERLACLQEDTAEDRKAAHLLSPGKSDDHSTVALIDAAREKIAELEAEVALVTSQARHNANAWIAAVKSRGQALATVRELVGLLGRTRETGAPFHTDISIDAHDCGGSRCLACEIDTALARIAKEQETK